MFKISNNDFKILNVYKTFLNRFDNSLENVPRRDYYYKDKCKQISNELLMLLFECSYEKDNNNIDYYFKKIKSCIAYLDFMLDRLFCRKYISDKSLYLLGEELVQINKMITGWINNLK